MLLISLKSNEEPKAGILTQTFLLCLNMCYSSKEENISKKNSFTIYLIIYTILPKAINNIFFKSEDVSIILCVCTSVRPSLTFTQL